jgi:kinesin family member 11
LNLEETLSTLDYAHKAKSIRNKPEINQKLIKKALIKEYTEENENLKRQLQAARDKTGIFLPEDMHAAMEAKLVSQKDEIREMTQRIAMLNEELEITTDQLKDTRYELDEKKKRFLELKNRLIETEERLTAAETENNEKQFLIDKQIETEEKLNTLASNLIEKNREADADCAKLQTKVENLKVTMNKNKETLATYAQTFMASTGQMFNLDSAAFADNKQKLTKLFSNLSEMADKVQNNSNENICSIQLFTSKLFNWLKSQDQMIEVEIETRVNDFFSNLIQTINNRQHSIVDFIQGQLGQGQTLMEDFIAKQEIFDSAMSRIKNNHQIFDEAMNSNLEQTLAECCDDLKANNCYYRLQLDSINDIDKQSNQVDNEFTQNCSKFIDELKDRIDSFNKLIQNNRKQTNDIQIKKEKEINVIRTAIDDNESSLVKKINENEADLKETIHGLIVANTKIMNELDATSASTVNQFEASNSLIQTSLNNIQQTTNATSDQLNTIITDEKQIITKKLNKNKIIAKEFNKECDEFFQKYVSEGIEEEAASLLTTIQQSQTLTTAITQDVEAISNETKSHLTTAQGVMDKYINNDYIQVLPPTSETPKPKSYYSPKVIERTRPHDELRHEFREAVKRRLTDTTDSDNEICPPPAKQILTSNQNNSNEILSKVPSQNGIQIKSNDTSQKTMKRPANVADQENNNNKSKKETILKRVKSVSRMK